MGQAGNLGATLAQPSRRLGDLMDEQVRAPGIRNEVFRVARISGQGDGTPVVRKAKAERRLDRLVIDKECPNFGAIPRPEETVINLHHLHADTFRAAPGFRRAYRNVEIVGRTQVLHHGLCPGGAIDHQRRRATFDDPACQPQVHEPDHMVRMQVSQEDRIDVIGAHTDLVQPLHDAPPCIHQNACVAGLNQRRRTEAFQQRCRIPGAEQCHFQVRSLRRRRHSGGTGHERKGQQQRNVSHGDHRQRP